MSKARETYRSYRWLRKRKRIAAAKKHSQLISKNASSRILVILHLYYQQSWKEIKEYLLNLGDYSFDLIVTVTEGNTDPAVLGDVRAFPHTRQIIPCKNQGFDLGPFFRVLNEVDLDAYDIVFKLQSKSTKRSWIYIYRQLFFRRDWFVNLYEGILSAENAHLAVDALSGDGNIGLVAAENLIVPDPPHKKALIHGQAVSRGLPMPEDYRFVAGTCFAVRACCLKPIQDMHIQLQDFQNTLASRGLSFAHFIERYLCACVNNQGYTLHGLPALRFQRTLVRPLERLLWRFSSERLFEEDIDIDPEYFLWQLDNKLISYRYVTLPIGSLNYCHDFKNYPFTKCPPYRYLKGDVDGYLRYCAYHEAAGLPQMRPERFDALRRSIQENGFNPRNIIIITDQNVIADGQHRACCLCDMLGEDAPVRVLKVRQVGLKAFIKRLLPNSVLRFIIHKRDQKKGLS